MKTSTIKYMILAAVMLVSASCRKLIDIPAPVNSVNGENVFEDDQIAASALTGIYVTMSRGSFTGSGLTSISLFAGFSADELQIISTNSNGVYQAYYRNALTRFNTVTTDYWKISYPLIFSVNLAIEGLPISNHVDPAVQRQLLGEAYFTRAFLYFYLVNFYGDVPLALSSDFEKNSLLSRAPAAAVYGQIKEDLLKAKDLLSENYMKADAKTAYPLGQEERVRPSKWAALALLSRVYLFTGDYPAAEMEADKVIANTGLFEPVGLAGAFLKNSREAIWQLQPVLNGQNTQDARTFILPATGPSSAFPVYLSKSLYESFEKGDQRRFGRNWIDSVKSGVNTYFYVNKYKQKTTNATSISEYNTVLRIGEQFLIRAEARARQGKLDLAREDLNVIRRRAKLANSTESDQNLLLEQILGEKRSELFTEWGSRWLELKRLNRTEQVMPAATLLKGGVWKNTAKFFPVSDSEMKVGPNLVQTEGYQ